MNPSRFRNKDHGVDASPAVDYAMFFAVALMWSGSFLLIKVAVAEISPLGITAARVAIADSGRVRTRAERTGLGGLPSRTRRLS